MALRVLTGALALVACGPAAAQFGVAWKHSPRIVVIASTSTDDRLDRVDQAIAYWNERLAEIGSAFRLGAPQRLIQPPPDEALQAQGDLILRGAAQGSNVPTALSTLPGELRIVLGDQPFVSHAGPFDDTGGRTVGIRPATMLPLSLPNVALNVIAHEIGHAIGLGHNADPAALMCGRPAPCRPDAFRSTQSRLFPLLPHERDALLRLYPPDWRPAGGASR